MNQQNPSSRMCLQNVVKGRLLKSIRVLVYGPEGVGKSTFGAEAPNPIFLCSEDGTAQLDVARFPAPQSWGDALEAIGVLIRDQHDYKTVVIDTLDWLEPLCWQFVCQSHGKRSIEDLGYGKGYIYALDEWRKLIGLLGDLEFKRKMNVVLLAHSQVKRQEDPDSQPFDRFRLKLHEKTADLFREWTDTVLFARHEVRVNSSGKTGKAKGQATGARFLHTEWRAAYDAKNRNSLPSQLPLDWTQFEEAMLTGEPDIAERLRKEISAILPDLSPARQEAGKKALDTVGDSPRLLARLLDKMRAEIAIATAASEGQ